MTSPIVRLAFALVRTWTRLYTLTAAGEAARSAAQKATPEKTAKRPRRRLAPA